VCCSPGGLPRDGLTHSRRSVMWRSTSGSSIYSLIVSIAALVEGELMGRVPFSGAGQPKYRRASTRDQTVCRPHRGIRSCGVLVFLGHAVLVALVIRVGSAANLSLVRNDFGENGVDPSKILQVRTMVGRCRKCRLMVQGRGSSRVLMQPCIQCFTMITKYSNCWFDYLR